MAAPTDPTGELARYCRVVNACACDDVAEQLWQVSQSLLDAA